MYISEELKEAQVRMLCKQNGASESENRELVDGLWSDPDRRDEFSKRFEFHFAQSEIAQKVDPGIDAEMQETLRGIAESGEAPKPGASVPGVLSLLEDAGLKEEYLKAVSTAYRRAFTDCLLDYRKREER